MSVATFPALTQPRTIRLLAGFPLGGGTDAVARLLAERLKDELGANVVLDRRRQLGAQSGVSAPASTPEFLVKLIGEKYKLDRAAARIAAARR